MPGGVRLVCTMCFLISTEGRLYKWSVTSPERRCLPEHIMLKSQHARSCTDGNAFKVRGQISDLVGWTLVDRLGAKDCVWVPVCGFHLLIPVSGIPCQCYWHLEILFKYENQLLWLSTSHKGLDNTWSPKVKHAQVISSQRCGAEGSEWGWPRLILQKDEALRRELLAWGDEES